MTEFPKQANSTVATFTIMSVSFHHDSNTIIELACYLQSWVLRSMTHLYTKDLSLDYSFYELYWLSCACLARLMCSMTARSRELSSCLGFWSSAIHDRSLSYRGASLSLCYIDCCLCSWIYQDYLHSY